MEDSKNNYIGKKSLDSKSSPVVIISTKQSQTQVKNVKPPVKPKETKKK